MKKLLIGAALGVLVACGFAFAQVQPIPTVSSINPTTDLIQIIPRGQPSAQSVFATPAQLATQEQYVKLNMTAAPPVAGYTQTFANSQSDVMLLANATISYFYFTFAPNPSDGARECFYANQTVTSAYPTANTGQTVNSSNTITSMTASTRYCFLYSASNTTWDRD